MATTASSANTNYKVLRDSREKEDHGWIFPKDSRCQGTSDQHLPTGDYTLLGYEKLFIIERKGSVAEFAANVVQERFERELTRMDDFVHPYLVLEFDLADIISFPVNSGIPQDKWKDLKMTPKFFMLRLMEIQLQHDCKVVFVGKYGREFASSLFKRVVENVPIGP